MSERKEIFAEWLSLYGSFVALPPPGDMSDESLRHYFHRLCLQFHPDKQGPASEHRKRAEHLFARLNNIYDLYTKTDDPLPRPGPDFCEADDEVPVDHEADAIPKSFTRTGKRVYLVTFSHSDSTERKSPCDFSREQFGKLLIEAFEASVPKLRVAYLAVFRERHAAGLDATSRNVHFHASVKSSRQHIWAPIAAYLREKHRLFVHFATSGEGYHTAFRYGWWPSKRKPMSELDGDFALLDGSEKHPSPEDAAKRPAFWAGGKRRAPPEESDSSEAEEMGLDSSSPSKPKRELLFAYVYRVIQEHHLWTADKLQAYANKVKDQRLISVCFSKNVAGIVDKAVRLAEAEARVKRSEKSRLTILEEAAEGSCSCGRPGEWKAMALDLLRLQQIPAFQFASAVVSAVETGASKGINIFLFGPTSSGKSWILDPLRLVFSCHLTPPRKSGFPLQELPEKEAILWQDFRVDEDVLPWGSLLLLFEGTQITIRRPRNEFTCDLDFTVTQPVFISSVAKLVHHEPDEQKMMDGRFRFFHFYKTLPSSLRRKVPPCAFCFASLWVTLTKPPCLGPLLSFSSQGSPRGSMGVGECSQGGSSSDSAFTRSVSSDLQFCGHCGLALSSSPYCRATGEKHL